MQAPVIAPIIAPWNCLADLPISIDLPAAPRKKSEDAPPGGSDEIAMVSSFAWLALFAVAAEGFHVSPAAKNLPRPSSRFFPEGKTARQAPLMLTPPEIIDAGVALDTFAPQPFWLLMLAAPDSRLTRSIMGPIFPIIALSIVHLIIVLLAASAPGGTEPILIFADVFDPAKSQLDGMVRLFEVRDFVAEEWPHVLIW